MKETVKSINKNIDNGLDGEFIEFPVPVINPYMAKLCANELAKAAGVSVSELNELLASEVSSADECCCSCKVETLLKKYAPQSLEKYILRKLPILDDKNLSDWYARIISRVERYKKLLELDSPTLIANNEANQIQSAVNDLYFGNAKVNKDGGCLWSIVKKILNV